MALKPLLINDPIYGFIAIQSPLIKQLIDHPYFQRLRRITQMGLSVYVFPGAHHNRFEHALGCMHLAQKAVASLCEKGVAISTEESEALQIALLFHDIGHGPFSHAIEKALLPGIAHEQISEGLMREINNEFDGALEMALSIFNNSYPRKFFHQLLVGQVDLDRLDYLKRDSFYTGAQEGNINSSRLISMMQVVDDQLVFEQKASYSLEKFLLARRLMYWQVYLHKTSLVSELLLVKVLDQARLLLSEGKLLDGSKHLLTLLSSVASKDLFTTHLWQNFVALDDADVWYSIKQWQKQEDFILKDLSRRLIQRDLFQIQMQNSNFKAQELASLKKQWGAVYQDSKVGEAYVFSGSVTNQTYSSDKHKLFLMDGAGNIIPIHQHESFTALMKYTKAQTQYYLCTPKN